MTHWWKCLTLKLYCDLLLLIRVVGIVIAFFLNSFVTLRPPLQVKPSFSSFFLEMDPKDPTGTEVTIQIPGSTGENRGPLLPMGEASLKIFLSSRVVEDGVNLP